MSPTQQNLNNTKNTMKKYNITSLIIPASYIAIIFIYLKLMLAYAYMYMMYLMHSHPAILLWSSGLITDLASIFLGYLLVEKLLKRWRATNLIKLIVLAVLLIAYARLTMPQINY